MRAKRFFLTFAACPIPIETAQNQLMARFALDYLLISQETAPTTGNLHLHALLLFKGQFSTYDATTFDIKDDNGQTYHPNVQVVQSLTWTVNYIKKDGNWKEIGICPVRQKRLEAKEKIEFMKNHSIDEIIDSGNFSIAEIKNCMMIKREIGAQKMTWPFFKKRQVFWYWGATGTGKTRRAVKECQEFAEDDWTILSGDLRNFMIGYSGERAVIIDDIRAGTMLFAQLLRITDGYRCIVNIKGGHREWVAERIYITAPIRPEEMYKNKETGEIWDHTDQLLRRITEEHIIEFRGEPEETANEEKPETHHSFRVPPPEVMNEGDTEILYSPIQLANQENEGPHLHSSNEIKGVKNFLEPQWEWDGAP